MRLPYEMFDLAESAADARRFDRMEGIYHKGQSLVWNGKDVLDALVKKHGGVRVPREKHAALRSVFGSILWGELAAWKVSAQLADRIEPLGAKMAATSQAHDEARHFYVMHDYLQLALGDVPRRTAPASERLLFDVLSVDDLACKLLGMQLQVETTALTLFQHAREVAFCPVLADLLLYFEKDEARHVGLGIQYLPMLVAQMGPIDRARFTAFAIKVSLRLLAANHAMQDDLRALGLDPRRVLRLAKSKQLIVFEELWAAAPGSKSRAGEIASLGLEALANALWPEKGDEHLAGRVRAFVQALREDGVAPVVTSIVPNEATPATIDGDA
jgi:hypothetical protein